MGSVSIVRNEYSVEKVARCWGAHAEMLSSYPLVSFWQAIEATDVPLEVLVHCVRWVIAPGDDEGCRRVLEVIISRIQRSNERWASLVLKSLAMPMDEYITLMCDLCADLYECVLRAVLDPQRLFWEENFLHCLYFERKHVYSSFMRREGLCYDVWKSSERIPRALISSLDRPGLWAHDQSEHSSLDIEDDRAQIVLCSVELSDLRQVVQCLPETLRMVILSIFWEGRTEKDTAWRLGVTDRTVRNRLRRALQLLRVALHNERELMHG